MRFLALLFAVLSSGCLCCGGLGEEPVDEVLPEPAPVEITVTSPTTSTTTTTTAPLPFDLDDLVVTLAGCDSDHYGNAMVAGYVTNTASEVAGNVTIVARLESGNESVVDGGLKELEVYDLRPGEMRKFAVVLEKPPQWSRCSASVKG